MTELWLTTRDWLMDNPAWIYGLIFGLAALEAVAIIGSIIPAVPMMVGLTLLAGSAGLDLPTVLLVAVLGAMLGDGISYVIGHHFKHRIDGWWPFRTHPDWLANAEGYVERHGGKSLIIGRFVGPIRAFVPMAAGIFQMPVRRFLWYNFVSAVLWAPPNILPGYIAGAAVTHPLMPGKHQLLFVSVILVTVALMAWLLPRLSAITRKWRQGHAPRNQGLFRASDNHPENQLMTLIVGLGGLLVFTVVATLLPALTPWDQWVAGELHTLRQPSIDYLFLVFTLLGDPAALATMGGILGAWLLLRREWRALLYAALAAATCLTLPELLLHLFAVPGPDTASRAFGDWSFPSAHAFSATVFWGFLYVLVSRRAPDGTKPWALATGLSMIAFTAISRTFLGAHWATDVLAGLGLGLAMLALLRWRWYLGADLAHARAWELPIVLLIAVTVAVLIWVWPDWAHALLQYADQLPDLQDL